MKDYIWNKTSISSRTTGVILEAHTYSVTTGRPIRCSSS